MGAAIGAIGGFFSSFGFGFSTIFGTIAKLAVSFAISSIFKKDPERPSAQQAVSQIQSRKITGTTSTGPRQLIYGTARVGGQLIDHFSNGNDQYYNRVYALAGHEVNAVTEIWFDSTRVWTNGGGVVSNYASKLTVGIGLGTAAQTTLSTLTSTLSTRWTANHRCRGVAIAHIKFQRDETLFPNGQLPSIISFTIQGKKVLNLATSTTAYTTNPAYCIYDYLVNHAGIESSLIDSQSFIDAASVCNESVSLASGSAESRYTCNGVVNLDGTHGSVLDAMLTSCNGELVWSGAAFKLIVGKYYTPVATITEDDIVSEFTVQTSLPRSNRITVVRGTFSDPNNNYEAADYPAAYDNSLATSYGEQIYLDFPQPFTSSATQAKRVATQKLQESQRAISLQLKLKLSHLALEAGDNVYLTISRFSWTNKTFKVVDKSLNFDPQGPGMSVTLREIDSAIYGWATSQEGSQGSYQSISLPNIYTVALPVGFAVTSNSTTSVSNPDGSVNYRALLSWTQPTDTKVKITEVFWKKSTDTNYIYLTSVNEPTITQVYVSDLTFGVNYDFRIRHKNIYGGVSSYSALINVLAGGVTTSTVANHTVNLSGAGAIMQSSNFVAGSTGWQILGNGNAEFNNLTIRGSLSTNAGIFRDGYETRLANSVISGGYVNNAPANTDWTGTYYAGPSTITFYSYKSSNAAANPSNRFVKDTLTGLYWINVEPIPTAYNTGDFATGNVDIQYRIDSGAWTTLTSGTAAQYCIHGTTGNTNLTYGGSLTGYMALNVASALNTVEFRYVQQGKGAQMISYGITFFNL